MAKGFIYIAKNQSMPGLLKIGYTVKIPDIRLEELDSTGVPEPFELAYYCLVDDVKRLEREIHNRLKSFRHSDRREFFRIDLESVLSVVSSLCTPEHEWQPPEPPKHAIISDCRHDVVSEDQEIIAYSRHDVVSEDRELKNFVRLVKEQSLNILVREAYYDSNSCCCNFELADGVEESSPEAGKILAIALETISQFEWFGFIQHGKPNNFRI